MQRKWIMIVGGLTLASCQSVDDPGSQKPASSFLAATAGKQGLAQAQKFVGRWEGDWQGSIDTVLVVEEILPGGKARVRYAWAAYPPSPAGEVELEATVKNGVLSWGSDPQYTFSPKPDGTLDAKQKSGDSIKQGLFTRVDPAKTARR